MPIDSYESPVYTISCGNADCTGPDEGLPATDEDHRTRYFETRTDARDWAGVEGWSTDPILCPPCAEEARERADQAQEITAAVQYAMGPDGPPAAD